MKRDYTMNDFHTEMRRRGVHNHPQDAAQTAPKPAPQVAKKKVTKKKEHGGAIVQIVPCGVHPLHLVKVRASGARSGCPMCEMQIETMCRTRPSSTPRGHAPLMALDRPRIVGCTCGWRTPPGTPDSEDVYIEHATVMR